LNKIKKINELNVNQNNVGRQLITNGNKYYLSGLSLLSFKVHLTS